MYRTILVPVDGTRFSERAVKEAAELARSLDAGLVLFYALPQEFPHFGEGLSTASAETDEEETKTGTKAGAILAAAAGLAKLPANRLERHFSVSNSPYDAILAAAHRYRCELIVMASHGIKGASAVLLGSETQKVLAHSKIPVLVVK